MADSKSNWADLEENVESSSIAFRKPKETWERHWRPEGFRIEDDDDDTVATVAPEPFETFQFIDRSEYCLAPKTSTTTDLGGNTVTEMCANNPTCRLRNQHVLILVLLPLPTDSYHDRL